MAAMSSLEAMKAYVTGGKPRQTADGIVLLDLEHNLLQRRFVEISFDTDMTIASVKERIYRMTGSKPDFMKVYLNRSTLLDDDSRKLAYYNPPATGGYIYIVDDDPYSNARGGGLDDVSQVEKYVMSDDDYEKRNKKD